MAKIIVRFITVVLELAAVLFLIGGGVVGLSYAIEYDELELAIITVPLGVLAGFIVATIVLGVPLLILRINQNLEEINATLRATTPERNQSLATASNQDIDSFN